MHNTEIAAVFFEMADLLAVQGGEVHRSKAFSRSARVIEKLPEPVSVMLKKGTLEDVPGIGEGTVHRIKQILRTGSCDTHRQLLASLPHGLAEMLKIRGLGPSRLRVIYSHLRISSVDALEAAARAGKLAGLPRIGQGTQEQILHGILTYRTRIDRVPLGTGLRRAEEILQAILAVPGVMRAEIAGSLRRRKESSKDLDVLVAADDRSAVTQAFMQLPQVVEVMIGHTSRASVRLRSGMQSDIRVLAPEEFGAGMHYFTGSKDHNIAMRNRANRMGMHLSDHGLFTREKEVLINPCPREEDVFTGLGLPFIPPELREDTGEIQAAERGQLPQLITAADLRGDLHMHTTFSDGSGTADEMARAAIDKGLGMIAITDHSYSLRETLGEQREHLQGLRSRYEKHGLRILQGVEVDILATGQLEMDTELLAQMDFVVASVHNQFELPYEIATQRLIHAIESGVVDVIGHPTGRRFSRRDPSAIDMERVLDAARRCGVAMEINGQPDRLDLDAVSARHAVELGVPLSINSDAHSTAEQQNQTLALYTGRRAWAEPRNVINCWSVNGILRWRHDRMRKVTVAIGIDLSQLPPPPPPDESDDEAAAGEATAGEPPAERVGGDDPAVLAELFRQTPLSSELLLRLQSWMQSGDDAAVEAALQLIGEIPVQVAFNLVLQSQQPAPPAPATEAESLASLQLPPRVQAALEKEGIATLPALLALSLPALRKVPGVGAKAVEQIVAALTDAGLQLRRK
ncbi:MAG: helix-hairpin-helix domain-containing protein [Planctomycetota bacterium]